jgi:hypothetical protein
MAVYRLRGREIGSTELGRLCVSILRVFTVPISARMGTITIGFEVVACQPRPPITISPRVSCTQDAAHVDDAHVDAHGWSMSVNT